MTVADLMDKLSSLFVDYERSQLDMRQLVMELNEAKRKGAELAQTLASANELIHSLQNQRRQLRDALELADMALDTAEAHIDEEDVEANALALQEIEAARKKIAALAGGNPAQQVPNPRGP